MSSLKAFLHPQPVSNKEIVISNRFVDPETGNVQPFVIRAVTGEDHKKIQNRCTRVDNVRKGTRSMDIAAYQSALIVAGTAEPDFTRSDMCEAYKVADPELIPGTMLTAGEMQKLFNAIWSLSGFDDDEAELAKN